MVAHSDFARLSNRKSIKVLDLLTNRYHLGVLRESSATHLQLELHGTGTASHFHAGQRVRFVVADDQPLVSRSSMARGFITNVAETQDNCFSVDLALLPETAVA